MSKSSSLLYGHPRFYSLAMRLVYGRHYEARYEALDREIPDGARVVDLCAGDCRIYTHYLNRRGINYTALDASPDMVATAKQRGIDARLFNVWTDDIPHGDVVMMQASLYQFIPHAEEVVGRMLDVATQLVIISEPIRNLATSSNPLLAWFGRTITKPDQGDSYTADRFDEPSLRTFFQAIPEFERGAYIPGKREVVGIFKGRHKA